MMTSSSLEVNQMYPSSSMVALSPVGERKEVSPNQANELQMELMSFPSRFGN